MAPFLSWRSMVSFIWSVKEVLRDHYRRHEYGEVILPMVVLRRLDSTLAESSASSAKEPSISRKEAVLNRAQGFEPPYDHHYDLLCRVADLEFYNTSKFDFRNLLGDEHAIFENFNDYLNGYSPNVREIIQAFDFWSHVERLHRAGILFHVIGRFADPRVDLSPSHVSSMDMGYIYEELIRTVADMSNEEAGEHFTPREVIELMVSLLVSDDQNLHKPARVITVYDPTCGTGGMLTEAKRKLLSINSSLRTHLRGQEVQPESFAIAKSDMLIKDERTARIELDDTLINDRFAEEQFDYVIANPPYGKDWKTVEKQVKAEHAQQGMAGRFGPGLPPTSDGQMLFLLHMLSKLKSPEQGGGRLAVVMNMAPLFSGDAGSGPSEIRRYLIEHDLLEAIVGLPTELFYNTGIATYVWVVTNRKTPERMGKVQLLDARDLFQKMPKSVGNKRNIIGDDQRRLIVSLYEDLVENERSKILDNELLGYRQVIVDRPLVGSDGKKPKPDVKLRDTEVIPLTESVEQHFQREVLPYFGDAWMDRSRDRIGYEIPFTKVFFRYSSNGAAKGPSRRMASLVTNPTYKNPGESRPYIALEHIAAGAGKLVEGAELTEDERTDAVLCEPGDVLFGKLRPYLAKVIHVDVPSICSSELLVLRPRPGEIDSRYLYYLCRSGQFVEWAIATCDGVKMPRTSWRELREFRIRPFPSFEEQRSIATKLDADCAEIDTKVDEYRKAVTELEQRKADLITIRVCDG